MLGEGQPKSFGAETAFELPYLTTRAEKDPRLVDAVLVPGASQQVIFAGHHGIVVPPNVILLASSLEGLQGQMVEFVYRGFTDNPNGLTDASNKLSDSHNSGWNGPIALPETDRLPGEDLAEWARYREWFIQYQPNGTHTLLPWRTIFTVTPPDDFLTYAALRAQDRLPTWSPGAPVVRQNVFSFN